jgi:hypothetical protein
MSKVIDEFRCEIIERAISNSDLIGAPPEAAAFIIADHDLVLAVWMTDDGPEMLPIKGADVLREIYASGIPTLRMDAIPVKNEEQARALCEIYLEPDRRH